MDTTNNSPQKFATSERGLILEAFLGILFLNWMFGFEITVLSALGVMIGHIMKISWRSH